MLGLVSGGCNAVAKQATPVQTTAADDNTTGIANPAAVYCEKQGYRLEMRTDPGGNQYGLCIFPDGSECDEWAYFRGECGPAGQDQATENKAVEAAKIMLANELDFDASQITVFSLNPTTWPDSCLGLASQGETCSMVETSGFRVTLSAGENNYTYHTDLTGENIRLETAGKQG
jgi:putative hemolysin